MNYNETLKAFEESGIDFEKVVIATEVKGTFYNLSSEEFENVCNYVKTISRRTHQDYWKIVLALDNLSSNSENEEYKKITDIPFCKVVDELRDITLYEMDWYKPRKFWKEKVFGFLLGFSLNFKKISTSFNLKINSNKK